MTSPKSDSKRCWVTLVTKPSYLPGVIILAHSLDKHESRIPLLVLHTDSLGTEAVQALASEAKRTSRMILHRVEPLRPREGQTNTSSVAERFADTFTKLRAFQVHELGYNKCVFLDADMAVFQNPDDLFDTKLSAQNQIVANHACVCNLDHDSWAPSNWHKGNCAYTPLTGPDQVAAPVTTESQPTYHLLNAGMFVYEPTAELWESMHHYFLTTDKLKDFQFPDQDFLIEYFRGRWQPTSWKYNAIKTMDYWHPRMWSDDVITVLHYIVDKPWERRTGADDIAGHLGRDKKTHKWWWDLYDSWRQETEEVTGQHVSGLVDTKEPIKEKILLPQEPGRPEDVYGLESKGSWS